MSKYRLEIGVFEGDRSALAKFSGRRGHPPVTVFARVDKPVTAYNFVADSFHIEKLCGRLS